MPAAEHALHEMLQRASIPALVMCLARITEDGRWLEAAGRVDVLVNCAGVLQRTLTPRRAIDEGAGPGRAHRSARQPALLRSAGPAHGRSGPRRHCQHRVGGGHAFGSAGLVQPAEIAAAVAFLASDMASGITGIDLPVDLGYLVATPWSSYGGLRGADHGRTP